MGKQENPKPQVQKEELREQAMPSKDSIPPPPPKQQSPPQPPPPPKENSK